MPAGNGVCAASLHGNRKLPGHKKKNKSEADGTQRLLRASLGVVSHPRKGFLSVPLLLSHVNAACASLVSESEARARPCSGLQ